MNCFVRRERMLEANNHAADFLSLGCFEWTGSVLATLRVYLVRKLSVWRGAGSLENI